MVRRLFLLNGLAILAVVCNHAVPQAFIAMFWWTDRYQLVDAIPNYDQFGTLTYYVLIAIAKLTFFSVPSFLFVSGFFIAYTARGQQSNLGWKVIKTRLVNLLVPYLIWSLVIFLIIWLESCLDICTVEPLGTYLVKLLTGGASRVYWYVVLICQFYLLSPWLVSLAKTHLRLLLLLAALAHLAGLIAVYLGLFVEVPRIAYVIFAEILFPRDLIYFVFGIVTGFHLPALKQWLARVKWGLVAMVIISAILTLIEAEVFYRIKGGGNDYTNHILGGYLTVPMTMYILSFILCFLAFEETPLPFSKLLNQLGSRSYGLFLLHPIVMEIVPRLIYHLAPWLLGYEILYQPVLIITGVGIPFIFMLFLANRPQTRVAYRYLFG